MKLVNTKIKGDTPFQWYLNSSTHVKRLCKIFDFYDLLIYRGNKSSNIEMWIQHPVNKYWFLEFKKEVLKMILDEGLYVEDWHILLADIKKLIIDNDAELTHVIKSSLTTDVKPIQLAYELREYQAIDVIKLVKTMQFHKTDKHTYSGLILSEQRTGKSRVALTTAAILSLDDEAMKIIICPKIAVQGWINEVLSLGKYGEITYVERPGDVTKLDNSYEGTRGVRIVTYDTLKRLNVNQMKKLLGETALNQTLIFDEVHRLRNFKTQQSEAVFKLKSLLLSICKNTFCAILGLTGTPAVRVSEDIFGPLTLVNSTKMALSPYYRAFNIFKEYFYICEDTSFGKVCKGLRKQYELNEIISSCSVQTKQEDLELFENYNKVYRKITLELDPIQSKMYSEVRESFESEEYGIDSENALVQMMKMLQICTDPSGLSSLYELTAPKLEWIRKFVLKNTIPIIVMCKKIKPLNKLSEIFDENCIKHGFLQGSCSLKKRAEIIEEFKKGSSQVLLIQSDMGREALTLPEAYCTIFIDRDFAQGHNEQAEARMTPIFGEKVTKVVVDLVMKDTLEELIYDRLIVRKDNINGVNDIRYILKGGE